MGFLRGLLASLLSLLLFVSLSTYSLVFTVTQTLFNPVFMTTQVNRLDLPLLAKETLGTQIPADQQYISRAMEKTARELEPWMKEQMRVIIFSSHNYFTDRTQSLNVTIQLERVRESLKENIRREIFASPPPQLVGVPRELWTPYIEQAAEQVTSQIPQTLVITENSFRAIAEKSFGAEGTSVMAQIRSYASYIRLANIALPLFMLLLIGLIILVNRNFKQASRDLGITLLGYGAFDNIGIILGEMFGPAAMEQIGDVPSAIQTWLPAFLTAVLAPMKVLGIALMIAGALLIILSFFFKSKRS